MSRIGRMPIPVPDGVQVGLEGQRIMVNGPRGALTMDVHPNMQVELVDDQMVISRPDDSIQNRSLHGLTRALVANMVTGVTEGFVKRLIINGVGYRAEVQGSALVLQVGFSHPVRIDAPEGITFEVDRAGRIISVAGNDKALVGEMAARIRAVRKPEPYKGKGIAYENEVVRRKPGKAGRVGGAL